MIYDDERREAAKNINKNFNAYHLRWENSCGDVKQFITKDVVERDFKCLEVLQENDYALVHYNKYKTTKEEFLLRLRALCD